MDTTNQKIYPIANHATSAALLTILLASASAVCFGQDLHQPFGRSVEEIAGQANAGDALRSSVSPNVRRLANQYGATAAWEPSSQPAGNLDTQERRTYAAQPFSNPLTANGTGPTPGNQQGNRFSLPAEIRNMGVGSNFPTVDPASDGFVLDPIGGTRPPAAMRSPAFPPIGNRDNQIARADADTEANEPARSGDSLTDEQLTQPGLGRGEPGSTNDESAIHEPPYWNGSNYRPNAVGKRLFNYGYNKEADVHTTGLVDLSEPFAIPHADHQTGHIPFHHGDFTPLPDYSHFTYDPMSEMTPYYGKSLNRTQHPWIELGRGMYLNGPVPPSQTWMGETNPVAPHFLVYGDYRTAIGYVDGGNGDFWVNAHRLNLDLDLKITATERIHAFIGPLDRGANFTRIVSDGGDVEFEEEFDADFDTFYFEGDLGAMLGGAMGIYPPFDMPIAFGIMPMLFQNGTWLNDNFLGAAITIPAKNSPRLQWSNFDITFFAGIDEINSDAFRGDDSLANIYGVHAFVEAYQGYLEVGYAFLDDTLSQGLGYHNIGVSFSRRYGQRISNSVRFITNVGQNPVSGEETADGQLLLIENALITNNYTSFVPYMNFFAGFGRPQSAARAGVAGGVLVNTGINFETDGLIGYPTLDATANDTAGAAVGINWLGDKIDWQLITEFAAVRTHGDDPNRNAPGDQYAFGLRYQRPISNAWLIRVDGMHGVRKELSDISGARFELRFKF